jgi:hypothetical protein
VYNKVLQLVLFSQYCRDYEIKEEGMDDVCNPLGKNRVEFRPDRYVYGNNLLADPDLDIGLISQRIQRDRAEECGLSSGPG